MSAVWGFPQGTPYTSHVWHLPVGDPIRCHLPLGFGRCIRTFLRAETSGRNPYNNSKWFSTRSKKPPIHCSDPPRLAACSPEH